MSEKLTLAGFAVLVVSLVLKEIFSWMREKNLQNRETRMKAIEDRLGSLFTQAETHDASHKKSFSQTDEMYQWHNKEDSDGVKVWYVRQSLETTLKETGNAIAVLAKNSELQTIAFRELIENQRNMLKEQVEMSKTLKDIEHSVED